jgi:uncharacterized protein (DUF952 family)
VATIFHIATHEDWDAAQQRASYVAPSLATEGFIHCSTAAQVASTANAIFRGRDDLLLLTIDEDRLTSEVRYEPAATPAHEGGSELFPHLYGALNLDAVTSAEPMPPREDGTFEAPA